MSLSAILDNPHLPTPPALALQIIDKSSKLECSAKEIVRLLSQDPGMCGKVLQAVNSATYGQPRTVASLERAVMVIGLKPLRSLVLGWSLSAIHLRNQNDLIWRYWQESVAGAVMARELAVRLGRPSPDDDLVAGLLRDLGVLVLLEIFGDEYQAIWSHPGRTGAELCAAEESAFGLDHCEVAAGLLHEWSLPDEIVDPIRHHHCPERFTDAAPPLLERARLLSFVADLARLNLKVPGQIGPLMRTARAHFQMEPAELAKFLGSVTPRINEFATLIKVDIGKCPDFAAIIAAGCHELVSLSTQSATAAPQSLGRERAVGDVKSAAADIQTLIVTDRVRGLTPPPCLPGNASKLPEFDSSHLHELPACGAHLGGYEVRVKLGQGGMGIVFKALDPVLNRFVAIKMLTLERVVSSEARERFLREARAAAAIQHENVITIYAVGEVHCLPYQVMEYVNGGSLQDRLGPEPLPWTEIIGYARQIAAGLSAAHARGVIHRDVKPANILLAHDSGTIKITDFGLARVRDAGAGLSAAGMWIGTPQYMSPEQFHAEGVDHRADLFALGSVLYTLCAGQLPFPGESLPVLMRAVCEETPLPLRSIRPDTPVWLEQLIAKLHAKRPADRYASAAEVLRAIDRQK